MKKKEFKKYQSSILYFILYLIMISVILWVAYGIIHFTVKQNMKNRAFDELHAKVEMQVTMTHKIIEREYNQLRIVERILTTEHSEIEAEQFRIIGEMMRENEKITMLGIADLSGNVLNSDGEAMGNISDREYFSDIVEGKATEKCERLDTTIRSDDSEILYAIPFYMNDKIAGVLFKSKRIADVEDTLVEDVQFDGNASMFVVDAIGNIILVGDKHDRFLLAHNLFDGCDNFQFTDQQLAELKNNLGKDVTGEMTFRQNDTVKYAVYTPTGVQDWTIFSMVDKEAAAQQYKNSDGVIKKSLIMIVVLFVISLLVSVLLILLHVRRQRRIKQERFYQYHGYKKVMNELTYPVFRYNVKEDKMTGNRKFQETYHHRVIEHFSENVHRWKSLHPEYNFDGLFTEIKKVVNERKIIAFESVLNVSGNQERWIKCILMPVTNGKGEEVIVFGTSMDTTQEHKQFEEAVEIMESVPVGLYRVYMNEPLHVEYVNEGFSRMLGYTQEEMNAIIGRDGSYANILEEPDWEKIKETTRARCQNDESDTQEYRMRCKDGSFLMVSDTMEVKYDSNGVKYGYGVVFDVSKYRETQEKNEKELEKLQVQLNESRIKISTGQMQPHFLYNALASIREIVLENPDYAADLIFDFTTHLRACIKSMASEELISFSQEIENIKAYVNIEKMRFGDRMQVKYDIQEEQFSVVPLSIQPLVENAIRHGIYERGSKGGIVKISSYREDQEIVIKVEDNGVGFDVQKIKKEVQNHERDSTGLQSLIFRFENVMNAKVNVESIIGEGTRITVRIPLKGETISESNYSR